VLSMLGVLDVFDIAHIDPRSAFGAHLFSEAGRLAYADREAWYGDPRAMRVAPQALIDTRYLRARAALLDLSTSLGRAPVGRPLTAVGEGAGAYSPERASTSHVSVVDAQGNAVSLTASIENAFGSRRMVRGFLLNNQLTDFSFQPHGAHGLHPNRVEPGKRPRSAMAPTFVFDGSGRLYAVTG